MGRITKKNPKYCQKDPYCALDAGHEGECSQKRPDCLGCKDIVSHIGSTHCESGSVASGGDHDHCICDLCF